MAWPARRPARGARPPAPRGLRARHPAAPAGGDGDRGQRPAGLNTHQLVTLASIAQRVGPGDDERAATARTLLARLRAGECLCVDPPLQYVLGRPGDWWPALPGPGASVLTESPYNTYTHHGLPPGPICSAGPAALRALA